MEIVVLDGPCAPLTEGELAVGARLNTATAKLSRSFLMKQAAGVFLVSNVMERGLEPIFAEPIDSDDTRSAQWKRIREVGADQRSCHTFASRAHFTEWQQQALEFFRAQAR